MYNDGTALAYIPIANFYICVKLSFGPTIAKFYIIAFLASIGLTLVGITFVSGLLTLVNLVAFIVVIIKLITKKYDLFCGSEFGLSASKSDIKGEFASFSTKEQITKDNAVETAPSVQETQEPVFIEKALDLNYDNGSIEVPTDGVSSSSSGNSDLSNLFSGNSTVSSDTEVSTSDTITDSSNQSDLFDQTLSSNDSTVSSTPVDISNDSDLSVSDSTTSETTIDSSNQSDLFDQTMSSDNSDDSDRSKELMNSLFTNDSNTVSNSTESSSVDLTESNTETVSQEEKSTANNSNAEGESDLAKFFK